VAYAVLNLETLLRVPQVETDLGFDVGATRIAFSWNVTGQWEIYGLPLDGQAGPQPLTGGPGARFAPQWSPDERRLAYVLDRDGSEAYDIHVYDCATGQDTNLTPDTPETILPHFHWSPDGQWIAFISNRAGCFDTYVMPASGDPARPMPGIPYPAQEVRWSPCARWLAVVVQARGQEQWTFIVPAGGGEAHPVRTDAGPICARDSRWSPAGRPRLAFASDIHGWFNIGLYELATGAITWLTEGDGDKESPAWSPDGQKLAYVVRHGPTTRLALLDLDSGHVATCQVAPGIHHRPTFTPDGRSVLFGFESPARPCDLWCLSVGDGSLRQLTWSLPTALHDVPFVWPQQVWYPSLDGASVPALLYRPPADRVAPAVVYVHGGPDWLAQAAWDPLVQHMVSRGWAVLAPNYRGSTGYGRAWQQANRFDLGGGDTQDVVAGADYLVAQGLAAPGRVAITGRSWGGYLTMTALTRYPDRWAGGSAVAPFLNWFTGHAQARADLQHWDRENLGDPEQNYERYYERSPFFFLDRVAAPVQLICGAHDVYCPASESIQARDRLLELGKPCDLVLYPDEGHVFLQIENVVDAARRRVDFLARVLEGPDSHHAASDEKVIEPSNAPDIRP